MMIFKCLSLFYCINFIYGVDITVKIDTSVLNVVDEKFLSICLDQSIISSNISHKFEFRSLRMKTLLNELSTSYLRFGGSPANWQFFDVPTKKLKHTLLTKYVILKKKFLGKLLSLIAATNHRLLLDLNLEMRFGNQWDPLSTIHLLKFLSKSKYADYVDFELGNEPVYMDINISPNQLAEDYVSLKQLIMQYPKLKNSSILGPAIVNLEKGRAYIKSLINGMHGSLKAATFHHYYFQGNTATFEDYLNVANFDNLYNAINLVKKSVQETKYPKTPIYIGETSDAWHSGTPNVSDRFVSGFLWLEKLGLGAKLGMKVIMRQTFYGFDYALIDQYYNPNPDYWLTWLHNILVGQKVIDISSNPAPATCRIYAHCTKRSNYYQSGAVTVFSLNLNRYENVTMRFNSQYDLQIKHLYLLEPFVDNTNDIPILSKKVKLNGNLLHMLDDSRMPKIQPVIIPALKPIILPPLTMAFIVFPKINSCI